MNTPIRSSPLRTSLARESHYSTLRVAMTVGLLLACFTLATVVAVASNDLRTDEETANVTEWATLTIEDRLKAYAEVLYGVRQAFELDIADYRNFGLEIDRLDVSSRLPGVQVIGAAHRVSADEVAEYTSAVNDASRRSGLEYPDFEIYPSSEATEFLPIDFIEPQVGNEKAFGLDFFSERNRANAARLAMETDRPAATGPVVLVQETGEQTAFLLMLPFYDPGSPISTVTERRDAFAGVVYAAFRMDDLMNGIFGSNKPVEVLIGDAKSGQLLFGDDPDGAWLSLSNDDPKVSTIGAFGRRWKMIVDGNEPAISMTERAVPWLISSFGLLSIGLFLATVRASRSTRARAEALAAEMTEELDALTEATSEAIVTVDQDGRVVGWNTGATRMFDVEVDEILGQPVDRLVPQNDRHAFAERFAGLFAADPSDSPFDRSFLLKGLRGNSDFPVEMTLSSWAARDERFTTAFIRDITDRVEAEQALNETGELLQSVLRAVTEMSVIATDTDGVVSVFNAGAERMLGYDADDVIGKATPTLFHDRHELSKRAIELGLDSLEDVLAPASLVDSVETRTWTYLRQDGGRVPVELTRAPRYDAAGNRRGAIGVAVDISARLEAEADQQRLLDQQHEIVARLTQVDRAKSDFVSTMSHELRTPLTSIMGYTELLSDDLASAEPTVRSGMVKMIERNAERLLTLVEDLLSLSQIESGLFKVRREPCDSAAILHSARESVALMAGERGITVDLDLDDDLPELVGDRSQLERIFVNLLTNAVKFSPECGEVAVRARVGDALVVSVEDHGIGIPHDEQHELFTRFFRSSTAIEHAIQGTGLGLSIVATIVDRHNGLIDVESTEGEGTTVTITLPIPESTSSTINAEEAYA